MQQENHFARSCAFLLSLGLSLFTLNYCFCNGWGGIRYHHCTILLEGEIQLQWKYGIFCMSLSAWFCKLVSHRLCGYSCRSRQFTRTPNVNTNPTTSSLNERGIPKPPHLASCGPMQCYSLKTLGRLGVGTVSRQSVMMSRRGVRTRQAGNVVCLAVA